MTDVLSFDRSIGRAAPITPTVAKGGSTPLPPLTDPQDGNFLGKPDFMAGREVCIVLYAESTSREAREQAWRDVQRERVSMITLGQAAKFLEERGVNWRMARDHEEILQAAKELERKIGPAN